MKKIHDYYELFLVYFLQYQTKDKLVKLHMRFEYK